MSSMKYLDETTKCYQFDLFRLILVYQYNFLICDVEQSRMNSVKNADYLYVCHHHQQRRAVSLFKEYLYMHSCVHPISENNLKLSLKKKNKTCHHKLVSFFLLFTCKAQMNV